MSPLRVNAERKFADQCAVCGNGAREIVIDGRINAINAVAEKSDGRGAAVEGAVMCRRIDALRQAADDAKTRAAKMLREVVCISCPAVRRVAAADDRKRRQIQYIGIAIDVQEYGWLGDEPEQFRIVGISDRQDVVPVVL